jgi:hypothetical protein
MFFSDAKPQEIPAFYGCKSSERKKSHDHGLMQLSMTVQVLNQKPRQDIGDMIGVIIDYLFVLHDWYG